MGIANFFDRQIIVSRLRDIAGTSKRSMTTTATVDGTVQERDPESITELDQVQARGWQAYFPEDADVNEGDKLTDQKTGKSYKVHEVTTKDYGINRHKDVILIEYDD